MIAAGDLIDVAIKAKQVIDRKDTSVLVFNEKTSELVEIDFRGTVKDVRKRLGDSPVAPPAIEEDAPKSVGRPKLGVVAREVTLLPRHWEWLNMQPGGASVALRKLVEEARKVNQNRDRVRLAQEGAYRFMSTMAGNEHGFEEAARSLFAGNKARFLEHIATWPIDIRNHAIKLAEAAF